MFAANAFWNRIAKHYAAQPVADESTYQRKLAETRRLLHPDMAVLEFGCGTGSTALAHAPHVRHIRAIDFSPKMLEIARHKAKASGIANVDFEQGDIESLDLAPAGLDLVMGHSILHLLHDKRAVLARIFEALRPGGLFISSTACIRDATPALGLLAPLINRISVLPHLDVMSAEDLLAAITGAGFEIEQQWRPDRKSALFVIARRPNTG